VWWLVLGLILLVVEATLGPDMCRRLPGDREAPASRAAAGISDCYLHRLERFRAAFGMPASPGGAVEPH
jgi:hypothetical protein